MHWRPQGACTRWGWVSAAVPPGSSGGPFFDHNGLLVGIVHAMVPAHGPILAQKTTVQVRSN
nr:hypothetical protein [Rhodoferax sp.]